MNVGCYFGAAGVGPDNDFYIAGGGFCTNAASPTNRTEKYDPVANTWTTIDNLNEAVYHTNGGFAGLGGTLFNTIAGYTGSTDINNTQQLVVAGHHPHTHSHEHSWGDSDSDIVCTWDGRIMVSVHTTSRWPHGSRGRFGGRVPL